MSSHPLPLSWQRCSQCSRELAAVDPHPQCPECGGLLDVLHRAPALRGQALQRMFAERRGALGGSDASGVWRFRELLMPEATNVVAFPEGNTPLLESAGVARWAELPGLRLKHEGFNPTGSFKDRGMTVGITQAKRVGARAVACASTGNTAASLAAYAARAELPALVLIPAGQVAAGKLAQSLAYGARTLLVRGDFDDCLRLGREASERLGVYLLNSVNPFRIEGQKSIVFELLEQCRWDPPEWIALPAGNLGNTAAFGKALRDACAAGLIDRLPRLLAVQAAGAAPFARSYDEQFATRYRVKAHTIATAINIGDPASYPRAVQAIRESNGVVTAVSDAELLEAKAVIDAAGVGCEPASAASAAGVRQLVRAGVIAPDDRVVAVLTGHVLKDPGILAWYHQDEAPPPPRANRPTEIDATLAAIERVLASAEGGS
jgi:threonine synthase